MQRRKAYDAGIIGLAAKDRLAAAESRIASGGKHFNEVLTAFNARTASNLTADQVQVLNKIFSDEVVTPFLAILQELSVISLNQVAYLRTAIAALRTAILVISGTFADAGFPQSEWRITMPDNKAAVLIEIATELLVNELKRRAVEHGMTVEELVAKAKTNWENAEEKADELSQKGHDGE
jgi:hypothetical protein